MMGQEQNLYCEGDEALQQVAQSCGRHTAASVQGQVGSQDPFAIPLNGS